HAWDSPAPPDANVSNFSAMHTRRLPAFQEARPCRSCADCREIPSLSVRVGLWVLGSESSVPPFPPRLRDFSGQIPAIDAQRSEANALRVPALLEIWV